MHRDPKTPELETKEEAVAASWSPVDRDRTIRGIRGGSTHRLILSRSGRAFGCGVCPIRRIRTRPEQLRSRCSATQDSVYPLPQGLCGQGADDAIHEEALAQAEGACLADEEARARRRLRQAEHRSVEDNSFKEFLGKEIIRLFPGCPQERAEVIVAYAGTRGADALAAVRVAGRSIPTP